MNILYLDAHPVLCAQFLCDQHICQTSSKYCQLLADCYSLYKLSESPIYIAKNSNKRYFNTNHPYSKWIRSNLTHFWWLQNLTREIIFEYEKRFKQPNYNKSFLNWTYNWQPVYSSDPQNLQDPPRRIPDIFKHDNIITAYRNYYRYQSTKIEMTWTDIKKPEWMIPNVRY